MAKRKPSGVYVRQTPDWFLRRCATCGASFWPSGAHATALDLFNDAKDGSWLHVYRVFVGNDGGGTYGMTRLQGHGANYLMDGVPIVITAPSLPGQLWLEILPPSYPGPLFPKDFPFFDAFIGDNGAASQDDWHDDGPLCLIPPGFSMRVYSIASTTQSDGQAMAATFKYAVLPDQGQ
jgi:hypothetical protein